MRYISTVLFAIISSSATAMPVDVSNYDFAALGSQPVFNGNFTSNIDSLDAAMSDAYTTSYAMSYDKPASIDLMFSDGSSQTSIYNGNGRDLSIFFVGAGTHQIGLSLFDGSSPLGTQTLSTTIYTKYCIDDGTGTCESGSATDMPIYVMDVDFDLFGISSEAVDKIRMDVSGASAVPSLVGAYYTQPTVVPVPAAVWLFGSGLGLLGLFTRRNKKA